MNFVSVFLALILENGLAGGIRVQAEGSLDLLGPGVEFLEQDWKLTLTSESLPVAELFRHDWLTFFAIPDARIELDLQFGKLYSAIQRTVKVTLLDPVIFGYPADTLTLAQLSFFELRLTSATGIALPDLPKDGWSVWLDVMLEQPYEQGSLSLGMFSPAGSTAYPALVGGSSGLMVRGRADYLYVAIPEVSSWFKVWIALVCFLLWSSIHYRWRMP